MDNQPDVSLILRIYKQAVKNVPLLKYGWILIGTACILALAAYFKLRNSDVFLFAIGVILISFFGFLFSFLLNVKDVFIKILLYFLVSCIVLTLSTGILGFGTFIIWEKPTFYMRWFPNEHPDFTSIKNDSVQVNVIQRQNKRDSVQPLPPEEEKKKIDKPIIISKKWSVLSGRICDANGKPIENATISTIDNAIKVRTDKEGVFRISSNSFTNNAKVKFLVQKEGFKEQEVYLYFGRNDLSIPLSKNEN